MEWNSNSRWFIIGIKSGGMIHMSDGGYLKEKEVREAVQAGQRSAETLPEGTDGR